MKYTSLAALALFTSLATAKDWPQWRGPDGTGISSETGVIRDWNKQKPKLLWNTEGSGKGFSSISIAEGVIYTSGNYNDKIKGQGVSAFSAKDGKLLWQTPITKLPPKHGYGGARSVPAIDDGHLYVTSSDGAIVCLTTQGENRLVQKLQR